VGPFGGSLGRVAGYQQRVARLIAEHGWMVQGVFPVEGDGPEVVPFGYTIGLTQAGLPELMISGWLGPEATQRLLNEAARRHLSREFEPGSLVSGVAAEGVVLRVRWASARAPVQQARNFFEGPPVNRVVRVLQLVWPDSGGRYAGEAGYSVEPRMAQELF
jgi:hypothetical protein